MNVPFSNLRYPSTLLAAIWWDADTGNAWNGSAIVTRTTAALVAGATTFTTDSNGFYELPVPTAIAALNGVVQVFVVQNQTAAQQSDIEPPNRPIAGGPLFVTPSPAVMAQIADDVTLTITPLQASVSNPLYATNDLSPIAQSSAPALAWEIVDGSGNPVDLSGKDVRMVVYQSTPGTAQPCDPFDETLTPVVQYETGGHGITISGMSNNTVTVQTTVAGNQTAGRFGYWLLNVTDRLPLSWGKYPVRPATWGT